MTEETQVEAPQKTDDREFNFRALEARYQRQLEQERAARLQAEQEREKLNLEIQQRYQVQEDDDDDAEPYIDKKRLNKKLDKFGKATQSDIQKSMELAKQQAKEELKQEIWLENHEDFYDVMEKYTESFSQRAPHLAKSILNMPNGFERQKLVYHNIKELGLDKPPVQKSSIQDTVDANRRSPYYQPSSVASPPYAAQGDFSPSGQKAAHEKMQQLKKNLRLG